MSGHVRRSARILATLVLPAPRYPTRTMFTFAPARPRRAKTRPFPCSPARPRRRRTRPPPARRARLLSRGTRPFPCKGVFEDGAHDRDPGPLLGPELELPPGLLQEHLQGAHGAA